MLMKDKKSAGISGSCCDRIIFSYVIG